MLDGSHDQTPRDRIVLSTLVAMRSFGDAMDRMHTGIRGEMDMNASDLAAVRMLVVREQRGEWVSPHDIAEHLGISSASTTKLLDRLTESGHVQRQPHPHDRRARIVVLTDAARQEFQRHFAKRMERMRAGMASFSDDELRAITAFLARMEEAFVS